jgi:hypothetical protein
MPYKAEVINSNHFFLFCVNMSKKKKTILKEPSFFLSFLFFFFVFLEKSNLFIDFLAILI